jgi:hypothetical protein
LPSWGLFDHIHSIVGSYVAAKFGKEVKAKNLDIKYGRYYFWHHVIKAIKEYHNLV